ncbi:YhcN/YlaJ family sporulation lipoprotein [Peribacillus sp. SCS-155]|uniref:YhcN/YlaJ family sporulation lipoprotein n=1 Tax=Peribacillus sedimenti TaxID=3115297 RepID=UPI003906CFFC
MTRWTKRLILPIAIIMSSSVLAGCSGNKGNDKEQAALLGRANQQSMNVKGIKHTNDSLPEQVKREVADMKGIYDVVVVQNGKKFLVAYKVNHLNRFRMKQIEKQVNQKLTNKFKGSQFIISSDYKIFLEAVRLNEMLKTQDVPQKKATKRFEEIEKLSKEMT